MIRLYSSLNVLKPQVPSRNKSESSESILHLGVADVTISWHERRRELGEDDVQAARNWLVRSGF